MTVLQTHGRTSAAVAGQGCLLIYQLAIEYITKRLVGAGACTGSSISALIHINAIHPKLPIDHLLLIAAWLGAAG